MRRRIRLTPDIIILSVVSKKKKLRVLWIVSSTITKRPKESIKERKKNKKLSSSMINIKNKYEYMTDYKDNEKPEEYKDDENEGVNMHKMKGKMNIIPKRRFIPLK